MIHRELQRMWEHSWYLRALPSWLLALADHLETSTGVQRVLRIEWGEDDEKQSLIWSAVRSTAFPPGPRAIDLHPSQPSQ